MIDSSAPERRNIQALEEPNTILADGAVEVSVVIPCLNEANSIGICVDKALEAFRSGGLK